MALSAAQIAQFYEIIGIPQAGASLAVNTIADPFGASADTFTHAAVITAIDARLAALSSDNVTRVGVHLTRWTAIGGTAPTVIHDAAGSTPADYPRERAEIRTALCNIVGVKVAKNLWGGADNRFSLFR